MDPVSSRYINLGWWIVRPENWFERKKVDAHKIPANRSEEERQNNLSQKAKLQQDSTIFFEGGLKQQNSHIQNHTKEGKGRISRKENSGTLAQNKNRTKQNELKEKKNRSEKVKHTNSPSNNRNPVAKTNQDDGGNSDLSRHQNIVEDSIATIDDQKVVITKASPEEEKKASTSQNTQAKPVKRDSSESSFSFAAGFSLHQQLPINGQKFVPYNSEGRKGTLADYIPSVYVRMYKRDKWFIQSEFRYGAPQYTKEFLYQQRTDSARNGFITQSTSLKKTYYHQLPLTFNYFISKNLSVGAGIMWNKFVSAISSQDIVQHNNLTGTDSIISKGTILVPKITDSGNVFVRSWFQALFEAEYKWKRFSVGAKYAVGLEPYIKFELQAGVPQQEKNSSVDIFLRYELWRSKKK